MFEKSTLFLISLIVGAFVVSVCTPEGDEPAPVNLPVRTTGDGMDSVTTDEGWTVTPTVFRLAVADVELTIEGETHASVLKRLAEWMVPSAQAHPGHSAGGDVIGELSGLFLLDLLSADQNLGKATLLPGDYTGMNLHFRSAGVDDGIDETDPLFGHTAHIEGVAEKDGTTVDFIAVLDVPADTEMVGGPFEASVTSDTKGSLTLSVFTLDPVEKDTMFDGLDFSALDADDEGRGTIAPGEAAHNILAKTIIRHDHYGMTLALNQ